MKNNPSCLAAICLAGLFAALTFYAQQNEREQQHERFQMLFNVCFANPISPNRTSQELLSPPPARRHPPVRN